MIKRILKIVVIIVIAVFLLGLSAITWHSNSIIASMSNIRIDKKDELVRNYNGEVDRITAMSSDGIKISSWRFKTPDPKCVVIVLHGMQGMDASSLLDFGKFFKNSGFDAFVLDMRAHGHSGGDKIGFGYTETKDVKALLDWIEKQKEYKDKKIILYGISMGGAAAINTAAERKDIDMVISVSGYESFERQFTDYMRNSQIPGFVVALYKPCVDIALFGRFRINPVSKSPVNEISKISPRPVFIIHGDKDSQTSVTQAYDLKKKSGSNTKLWIVKGADHMVVTDILNPKNAWYGNKILDFINSNL